jgi:anti-anti-sigma regulatory factor/PAS domain-containing protein
MNSANSRETESEALNFELEQARRTISRQARDLTKRKKEYECLSAIVSLYEDATKDLGDVLVQAAQILPFGWQYPDIASARITCLGQTYVSPGFAESPWCQSAELFFEGHAQGRLEIFYACERPEQDEGPFLKEERSLLDVVASRLSQMIELKLMEKELTDSKRELERNQQMFSSVFDGINEVIYVADMDTYELLYMNKAMIDAFGGQVGQLCHKVLQNRETPCPFCTNSIIREEYRGRSLIWEFQNIKTQNWYRCIDKAIPWPDGRVVRYEMAIDVTQVKEAEARLQRQAEAILELSTPIIRIWEGIMAAPLIGTLDPQRGQKFMERLLTEITATQSPLAIIDITGVPEVDTLGAQALLDTVRAARMLGAEIIITGISPAIATTMARLGIDMRGLDTRSTLAQGLELALDKTGRGIHSITDNAENAS